MMLMGVCQKKKRSPRLWEKPAESFSGEKNLIVCPLGRDHEVGTFLAMYEKKSGRKKKPPSLNREGRGVSRTKREKYGSVIKGKKVRKRNLNDPEFRRQKGKRLGVEKAQW